MKTHRFALDPDDYDATAGCPGGDLVTCIDVCPGFNKVAFGLCVTELKFRPVSSKNYGYNYRR